MLLRPMQQESKYDMAIMYDNKQILIIMKEN